MIVCVCHGVSDREIKTAIKNGASSVADLSASLGVGTCCGCCRETCADMVAEHACSGGGCSSILKAFPAFAPTPVAA
ncbi:MAG: (2Fe-2S)-binding protein [Rhodocyclaceae bacterium]|nr:(2Fe-2S)-binding protein [Rhodocyclaceae bacterium]